MVNLSDRQLGQDEINLLAKGLKFVPKPPKPTMEEVQSSLSDFNRRVKLAYFFYNKSNNRTDSSKLFTEKSDWSPNDLLLHPDLVKDLKNLSEEICELDLKNGPCNLTKPEKSALKSLKNDKNIIIKPADKGSATVIMNKSEYINEAQRQLSNTLHYKKLSQPVYPNVTAKVNQILDKLHKKKTINKKQLEYLQVPENPRNRQLYLVPKIHKDPSKWPVPNKMPPGRPIVSDCGSDTNRVAEYIDHFLAPLGCTHPSYVKDTPDFLKKVSQLKPKVDSFLVTIDVDALYTNINNQDGLKAVKESFSTHPSLNRPDSEILELLQICLENNDFIFNREWFLQTYGTPMGRKFAPNYANLFMAQWEKEALSKCPLQPDCYLRFLDDIFIIWPHSEPDFWTFFNILNNHHPTIKLKATIHPQTVDFLDVTLYKGPNFHLSSTLDTKVYFKPTDTHELLHKKSFHPKHTFKGIIKSQIIRFHRICNNPSDFEQACSILFKTLKTRGYSPRFLRYIKSQTLKQLNPTNNTSNGSSPCGQPNCKTCPFITTTSSVKDNKGKSFPINKPLTCSSSNVIYLIECKSCHMKYVGQTRNSLHERLIQHRSNIKLGNSDNRDPKKITLLTQHFSEAACGIQSLSITPIEHVPLQCDGLLPMSEILHIMQHEQQWIAKLNTKTPNGLNLLHELPPPLTFCPKFCDQSGQLSKLVRTSFDKIKLDYPGVFLRQNLLIAAKRNKNLKDLLVQTALKD